MSNFLSRSFCPPTRFSAAVSIGLLAFGLALGCNSAPAPNTGFSQQAPADAPTPHEPRRTRQPREAQPASTAGNFDYYLLTLSWSPEYCYSHQSAPECRAHAGFVLHGLWPENQDGTYPEHCTDAPLPRNLAEAGIFPDPGLARHEWQTHGTCSGMDAAAYFSTARKAFQSIQVPAALTHVTEQTTTSPLQLVRLFEQSNPGLPKGSVTMTCRGNFLSGAEVCVDKSLNPIACGASVPACRGNSVRVTPQ